MIATSIYYWIEHPETLNRKTLYELRTLLARYPYCQTLRLLYLKNLFLLCDSTFGNELRRSVFYVTDRRVLFYLIEGDKFNIPTPQEIAIIENEEQEEPSVDRTLSLIDAFLSKLPEDDFQITELDYAVDYTAFLNDETSTTEDYGDAPKLRGQSLIDDFIIKSEKAPVMDLKARSEDDPMELTQSLAEFEEKDEQTDGEDDAYFIETLAKIYIKQQRYSKALEIIKKLSLKYPKKKHLLCRPNPVSGEVDY